MRRRLAALDPAVAQAAARRVADRVMALPEIVQAEGVLTCLSFGHELDTFERLAKCVVGERLEPPRPAFVQVDDPQSTG
jgi:5-formyltetrahydrofolate cyclo-ligase